MYSAIRSCLLIHKVHVWLSRMFTAIRQCLVEVAEPWDNSLVDRNMCPLKFYHDLSFDMKSFHVTFGACWENTMAQVNQALDLVNKPSGKNYTRLHICIYIYIYFYNIYCALGVCLVIYLPSYINSRYG